MKDTKNTKNDNDLMRERNVHTRVWCGSRGERRRRGRVSERGGERERERERECAGKEERDSVGEERVRERKGFIDLCP